MNKLNSLRAFLTSCVEELKANPEKLLVFAEKGELHDVPRQPSLSFEYRYTATLVVTDFKDRSDKLFVPLLAWLKLNQPDRSDTKAVDFIAEILDNETVDIEIKVELSDSVTVTRNEDGTVSTANNPEPLLAGPFGENPDADLNDPMAEWLRHNA